jgi:protein-L-isoaspartate(D-aspartate) O-methyltransferase
MSSAALAKHNMIEQQIRPWEVLDNRVLSTLDRIDRVDYVDTAYSGLAYADCQIPVSDGVRMLPPNVEGRMLQALQVEKKDVALEIGCGRGFISACLGQLAKQVDSIDSDAALIDKAQQNLQHGGMTNVSFEQLNHRQLAQDKKYDVIAVTASIANIPENLKQALNVGGRLFVVTGHSPAMQAMLITRVDDSEWSAQSLFETDLPRLPG